MAVPRLFSRDHARNVKRWRDGQMDADFFALFETFRGYVDFWLLQDLVTDDYSAVRFFMPFDDFKPPAKPQDLDTYRDYRRLSLEFVDARNHRINNLAIESV